MKRYASKEILEYSKLILFQKDNSMRADKIDSMFRFYYEKSSVEIKAQMQIKISQLTAKIAEREKRIQDARTANGITDEVLIKLYELARKQAKMESDNNIMSYSVSNSVRKPEGGMTEETLTIGAGVVNMLLTEGDFLESERSSVTRLQLIIRNLQDLPSDKPPHGLKGHELTEQELNWLGF